MLLASAPIRGSSLAPTRGNSLAPIVLADASSIVLARVPESPADGAGVWLFANNGRDATRAAPRDYCPPELPPDAPAGYAWRDELSGEVARFERGCLKAADGMPKVLALVAGA